jgi:hypothetical protein
VEDRERLTVAGDGERSIRALVELGRGARARARADR